MQVLVSRWGNSLGVRVPKELAKQAGLSDGVRVEMTLEGDKLVMSTARPVYTLSELLVGMTPEAMQSAFGWGPDRGREIVD